MDNPIRRNPITKRMLSICIETRFPNRATMGPTKRIGKYWPIIPKVAIHVDSWTSMLNEKMSPFCIRFTVEFGNEWLFCNSFDWRSDISTLAIPKLAPVATASRLMINVVRSWIRFPVLLDSFSIVNKNECFKVLKPSNNWLLWIENKEKIYKRWTFNFLVGEHMGVFIEYVRNTAYYLLQKRSNGIRHHKDIKFSIIFWVKYLRCTKHINNWL